MSEVASVMSLGGHTLDFYVLRWFVGPEVLKYVYHGDHLADLFDVGVNTCILDGLGLPVVQLLAARGNGEDSSGKLKGPVTVDGNLDEVEEEEDNP